MSKSVLENIENGIELVKDNFLHYFKIIAIPYITFILSIIGFIGFSFGAIGESKKMIFAAILFGIMAIGCLCFAIKSLWDIVRMIIPICYLTKDLVNNSPIQSRKHYIEFTHNRNLKLFLLIISIAAIPIVLSLLISLLIFIIALLSKIQGLNALSGIITSLIIYITSFCFCLALPIFVFNKDLSIMDCLKQSCVIVKNNFIKILLLFGLLIAINCLIINALCVVAIMAVSLVTGLLMLISKMAAVILFFISLAIIMILAHILTIVFAYTIPAIWYIELTRTETNDPPKTEEINN